MVTLNYTQHAFQKVSHIWDSIVLYCICCAFWTIGVMSHLGLFLCNMWYRIYKREWARENLEEVSFSLQQVITLWVLDLYVDTFYSAIEFAASEESVRIKFKEPERVVIEYSMDHNFYVGSGALCGVNYIRELRELHLVHYEIRDWVYLSISGFWGIIDYAWSAFCILRLYSQNYKSEF